MPGPHPSDVSGMLVLSMLVVFGSAKLLAEVFERFGQPGLAGEILAGILIGPSVLNWVQPSDVMATFAQLGIMFLLFRVGLEIKAAELLNVGGTAALVAITGVIVPFFAGWGICAAWGKPRVECMFVGAAMTATSVGITAQVLAAKQLLSRVASRIILAAAVIDDVLALLVLGVVSSVAHAKVNVLELMLTAFFSIVFILIVVRWGSWTTNKVVQRLEGRLRVSEAPFVLTMILLFGLAALSAQAGVAAITGAFLAGTAATDALSRRVHEQVHGIAELFVPFFLAGIGLNLDVRAFTQSSTLLLALAILVAAVISKVLACGLGAMGYGADVAKRVGLGMIPRGEFCIVAAQIGLGLRVIEADTFAVVVAMAVVTTMLAPPLVNFAFRAEGRPDVVNA